MEDSAKRQEAGMWPIETDGTDVMTLVPQFIDSVSAFDLEHLEQFKSLWHDDVLIEYPMAVPHVPSRVQGKDKYLAFEAQAWALAETFPRKITNILVWHLVDPSWAFVTFDIEHGLSGANSFHKSAVVLILGAREGKIAYMREYFDSAAIIKAHKDLSAEFKGAFQTFAAGT